MKGAELKILFRISILSFPLNTREKMHHLRCPWYIPCM